MAEQRDISIGQPTDVAIVDEHRLPDLSERESLWLSHYFACGFNATEAALSAFGYDNYDTAKRVGWAMKHRPHVQLHIKAGVMEMGASKERITANLLAIANAPWSEMVQIKTRRGEIVDARMDLTSTVRANELLGREVGMFNEKMDHTVEVVQKRIVGVNLDDL